MRYISGIARRGARDSALVCVLVCARVCAALVVALLAVGLSGCMKWDYGVGGETFDEAGRGLFIINEGNFQYGNATLSYYDPSTGRVLNEVFLRANGMKLGDTAQSMTLHGGRAWVVVNNSQVIFAIDPTTFRELGRIENLTSPRHILFLSDEKAYVSQLWDNRIFIINPRTCSITGQIEIPGMTMQTGSTEEMLLLDGNVYVTCWSWQNSILRIDPATDTVTGRLEVGIQPRSITVDCNGRLRVLTDGGFEGSPYGFEAPKLVTINPLSFTIEDQFTFALGDSPLSLQTNSARDTLYWINNGVWRLNANSSVLPTAPFLGAEDGSQFYSLSVDPVTSEVYVADAIDYQQQAKVYRYSAAGVLRDEFYVGVNPGAFCWK